MIEEKLDFLIIGDLIDKEIPSNEVKDWLLKYKVISNEKKIILKLVTGFYIKFTTNKVKPLLFEFIRDNVKSNILFPPILCLKLAKTDLILENESLNEFKNYLNDLIEYIIDNEIL
ncbi:MAG: hypothetical protein EU539_10915 [Promethearchaeota archaeon]|nr:MAG: hypothetical protein EU539_10915 [Candidatus Lokiarchaeota archaeon]